MTGIEIRRAGEIESALADTDRQYLVGTLGRPQALAHIPDADVEVGVSHYRQDTADVPHLHPVQREFQYVVSGRAVLRDLRTGAEHLLGPGDFYAVEAGVPHAQKSKAGTHIVFFKHPAGNDKTEIEPDRELQAWLADFDF